MSKIKAVPRSKRRCAKMLERQFEEAVHCLYKENLFSELVEAGINIE